MFSFKLWVYFKMINSLIFYYTTFEFFHMFILIKYKFRNDSLGDIMWKHEKCPMLGGERRISNGGSHQSATEQRLTGNENGAKKACFGTDLCLWPSSS